MNKMVEKIFIVDGNGVNSISKNLISLARSIEKNGKDIHIVSLADFSDFQAELERSHELMAKELKYENMVPASIGESYENTLKIDYEHFRMLEESTETITKRDLARQKYQDSIKPRNSVCYKSNNGRGRK